MFIGSIGLYFIILSTKKYNILYNNCFPIAFLRLTGFGSFVNAVNPQIYILLILAKKTSLVFTLVSLGDSFRIVATPTYSRQIHTNHWYSNI